MPNTDREHLKALVGGLDLWHQFGAELPVDKAYKDAKHHTASTPDAGSDGAAGLWPRVKGRCPACGNDGTLFLANGGYVTCGWIECPDPLAAIPTPTPSPPIPDNIEPSDWKCSDNANCDGKCCDTTDTGGVEGPYRYVEDCIVGPTIGGMHPGMWSMEAIAQQLNAAHKAGASGSGEAAKEIKIGLCEGCEPITPHELHALYSITGDHPAADEVVASVRKKLSHTLGDLPEGAVSDEYKDYWVADHFATQNPASGSDGLRDEAQVAALAERNELGYCDCGGPMIDIGMGNDPVCRQAVVTCPTARPAWEAKLAPTITNERQQAAEAERRWINDAAAELGTFVVSPTQTTKSVEELDGPFRADGYSIYDDSGQGDGVGQLIAEGDTFTDALAAALSDGGMGDE